MRFCPACGVENPNGSRFCKECKTRLPEPGRHALTPEGEIPVGAPPGWRPVAAPESGQGFSTAALVLGLLGIPGIVLGAVALARHRPGHGRALAAIILGAVVTAVLAITLGPTLGGKDPLRQPLTVERIPVFAQAVEDRIATVETEAESLKTTLGPGADEELAPAYSRLQHARNLVAAMDSTWTDDDLLAARDSILSDLDEAHRYLTKS